MQLPLHTNEKTQYCHYWQHNAQTFKHQGCYSWMAEQISDISPKRILDVGCGTGEGIEALLDMYGADIIAIEENFDCIMATKNRIDARRLPTKVLPRLGYKEYADGRHDLILSDQPIDDRWSPFILIHGDVVLIHSDNPLTAFLKSCRKFDAITVWLPGVTQMRKSCKALDNLRIQQPRDYTLYLQNRVYEIADYALRPGGVLQIVDRGLVPDTDFVRSELIKSHEEQAAGTTLGFHKFEFREYKEVEGRGVGMFRENTNSTIRDDGRRAMISIIFKKE